MMLHNNKHPSKLNNFYSTHSLGLVVVCDVGLIVILYVNYDIFWVAIILDDNLDGMK